MGRSAFPYFSHAESEMGKTKKEGGFDRRCKSQNCWDSSNDVCEPLWRLCFRHYVARSYLWSVWLSNLLMSACQIRMNRMTDLNEHNPGWGLLGSIFAGYVPLASQSPYPITVYFVANYRLHLSHFGGLTPKLLTCQKVLTPKFRKYATPF